VNKIRYPRGSEWRRWDLQVHTPFSELSGDFGNDFDAYATQLFQAAHDRQIAAIGVTDYFSIEGYKHFRALIEDDEKLEATLGRALAHYARAVLLLPNIEFRTREIVRDPEGKDARVNFHVIFAEDLAVSDIEDHFLREIKFTAESTPGSQDEAYSLTLANLKTLGRRLKAEHPPFSSSSDLFIGMMNAVVSHESITETLERQPSRFKDKYLLIVPADEDLSEISWDGQGHLVRKVILQKAHMLFSSNAGTRAFGLGERHESKEAFKAEFKSLKPCVHGSDAHRFDELFEPKADRRLWIRANPTFNGLRQLLYEPDDRVFIGPEPPALQRIAQNSTKYLSDVDFSRTPDATAEEKWFGGAVPFNAGLIAIIGNKGSGKSALADVLGLLGDSHSQRYFSFLTPDRFLRPRLSLGRMFEGVATWRSGEIVTRLLDAEVDDAMPERVKYIPQNYLETICTELRENSATEFDREVEEVIFSHVEPAERLGKLTLQELIDYRTSEREDSINILRSQLSATNRVVVDLEARLTEPFKKALESEMDQRRAELKAHDAARPTPVTEPAEADEDDKTAAARKELASAVHEIERLDTELDATRSGLDDATRRAAAAARFGERIENLEAHVKRFYEESAGDASVLGISPTEVVSFTTNRASLEASQTAALRESEAARAQLDPAQAASLASQRASASVRAENVRARLDEPNRRYQEYLHQLATWERRRAEIVGDSQTPNSLRGVEGRLAALQEVPGRLEMERAARIDLLRQIFAAKEQLLTDYRELHAPVQDFITTHPVAHEVNALEFTASMYVADLIDGLLVRIHQGRRGSFQGERDGRNRLRALVAEADFDTGDGVITFVTKLEHALKHDLRSSSGNEVRISDQLRQGQSVEDTYDFIYGLSYLRPRFELLWRGKPLDQLSPGERGTLLLVFYLLIDRRDMPLIIDQPEENLDNETIALLLVPAVKYAKSRRQIMLVTHNPNLAVVCDADQVIHSRIDKADGNRITYTAGALEDPEITQRVVDVLEGTKPAFDLRDARYEVLERRE
jgi:predicted ATPase